MGFLDSIKDKLGDAWDYTTGKAGEALDYTTAKAGEGLKYAGDKVVEKTKEVTTDVMKGAWDAATGAEPTGDQSLVSSATSKLVGGVKENWLETLVGGLLAVTVGKWFGDFLPGDWKTSLTSMIVAGLLGAGLVKHFKGAAEDPAPAEPAAKVNMPSVPGGAQKPAAPAPLSTYKAPDLSAPLP